MIEHIFYMLLFAFLAFVNANKTCKFIQEGSGFLATFSLLIAGTSATFFGIEFLIVATGAYS